MKVETPFFPFCFASSGAAFAKLFAQKSKGMPVFSLSLTKLFDCAASEAIATLSLGLFNSLKAKECSLLKGFHRLSIDCLYYNHICIYNNEFL